MTNMACGTREEASETDFLLGSYSTSNLPPYSGGQEDGLADSVEESAENVSHLGFERPVACWGLRRGMASAVILCAIPYLLTFLVWKSRYWQVVKLWRTPQPSFDQSFDLSGTANAFLLPIPTHGGPNEADTGVNQAIVGESIPLSSDPASSVPHNDANEASISLPYTKIGVVQTKPGQGSFFYYWFGRDVYRAIRKERVTKRHKQQQEGVLSFALHQQQGQPDTFWLYQSFTSESYFLEKFTPTIYTNSNQSRIRNMLKFLVDDAPLLDLELQSPPVCSKGIRMGQMGMLGDANVSKNRDKQHDRRDLGVEAAGLLPPRSIYPPNLQTETETSNNTSPFDAPITANDTTIDKKSHSSKKNKKLGRQSSNIPYTVMMHITTKPGSGTEFGDWFCENAFKDLLAPDNTLWNFAIHASMQNPDELWMYQTFSNEWAFLKHAESLYLASFPSWWNQDAHNDNGNVQIDTLANLQQELQRYLAKPVEYVALEPTLMQFGMRMFPPKSKKRRQQHDNSNENHSHTKQRAKKDFSPLHIIHHPP